MWDALALVAVAVLLPTLALVTLIKDLKDLCGIRRQPRGFDVVVKKNEIR